MATNDVVLVTGSSSGFGRILVESLARVGYTVFASMRETQGRNAAANAEIRSLSEREGLSLHVVELDVTEEASVENAVKEVVSLFGRIDVLVNNAGLSYRGATDAFTVEQIQHLFDTNYFGVGRTNRSVVPYMRQQGSGLLVYMSSGGGQVVYPFMGLYSCSKFAMEALALSYHYEVSRLGIDSVIVEPGWYPTPILDRQVQPADADRVAGYAGLADVLRKIDVGIVSYHDGQELPKIQEVADLVAALIATPAGQRPLRVLVGQDVQYIAQLNQVAEETQAHLFARLGIADLLKPAPRKAEPDQR